MTPLRKRFQNHLTFKRLPPVRVAIICSAHYNDTLFVSLKSKCGKEGKHALEPPPNRVDHESVAVVLGASKQILYPFSLSSCP